MTICNAKIDVVMSNLLGTVWSFCKKSEECSASGECTYVHLGLFDLTQYKEVNVC